MKQTCRLANVLRNQCKVEKGDVVVIYMPAMPLAVAAMLACARIGAIHRLVPSLTSYRVMKVNLATGINDSFK